MKRLQFTIAWSRSRGQWLVSRDGAELGSDRIKSTVVDVWADALDQAWLFLAVESELTIKRKDGSIQDKRTYGEDPRRTRG